MIELREINEANFQKVIDLQVHNHQLEFVSSNVKSLAECYLYRHNQDVFPYAVYEADAIVGFLLVYTDDETNDITIWRMMIDKHVQKQGYGKKVLEHVIEYTKKKTQYTKIVVTTHPKNEGALKLYRSFGFEEQTLNEHNEVMLAFPVTRDA